MHRLSRKRHDSQSSQIAFWGIWDQSTKETNRPKNQSTKESHYFLSNLCNHDKCSDPDQDGSQGLDLSYRFTKSLHDQGYPLLFERDFRFAHNERTQASCHVSFPKYFMSSFPGHPRWRFLSCSSRHRYVSHHHPYVSHRIGKSWTFFSSVAEVEHITIIRFYLVKAVKL